jgi:GrpB-like predicted nucleotidyltransferase (UPF0157 family)
MIEIVPYNEKWPREFCNIASRIKDAVGGHVLAVHHIGSTSVPGLAAKDVIDIQISVENLQVPLDEGLVSIGFEPTQITSDHCPSGMTLSEEHLTKRYFRTPDRRVHLHVRQCETFNQKYPILFRDYLRSNALSRDAYGEIKQQLSRYFPNNVDAYYNIKDPVCDLIISSALAWAEATGWRPGPCEA